MAYELLNARQAAILAELEATYRTDPAGTKTGLLMNTGASSKITVDKVERDVLDSEFGSFGSSIVGKKWEKSYEMEMKGLGASVGVVVEPEISIPLQVSAQEKTGGYLLTLSGITGTFERGEVLANTTVGNTGNIGVIEDIDTDALVVRVRATDANVPVSTDTIEGDTSGATATISAAPKLGIMYTPVSDDSSHKSATIYHYEGGVNGRRKVGLGARSNGVFTGTVKALPKLAWTVQSIYQAPTDVDTPDTTVSIVRPQPLAGVTVKFGSADMTKIAFNNFELDFGNDVQALDDMQQSDAIGVIRIVNAMPTLKMKLSAPKLATYNPYTALSDETTASTAITYGTGDGKRIRIGVPYAQVNDIGESVDQETVFYDLSMTANKTSAGSRKHYIFVY